MARAYASLGLDTLPLVIPAPMHARRKRQRGNNQAELLSKALARMLALPHSNALFKSRNTPQQALLSHEERIENLQGSVSTNVDLSGRDILLIDDVYTTGATMHACADVLTKAGARAVYVLTYAATSESLHKDTNAHRTREASNK